MNVAVLDITRKIVAINVHSDDYTLKDNEIEVVGEAFVDGFYIDGRFIPPKPYPSWILDEATCLWDAPVPYPTDGGMCVWDEASGDWVAAEEPAL